MFIFQSFYRVEFREIDCRVEPREARTRWLLVPVHVGQQPDVPGSQVGSPEDGRASENESSESYKDWLDTGRNGR